MESKKPNNVYLDWGVALGGLWLLAGLHLDGWAHHRISLETFFTPWHAVLYSGFFVTAAVVGVGFVQGLRRETTWRSAFSRNAFSRSAFSHTLPRAYRTSLLGAVLFFFGGLADMTWHTLFGIENDLEALLSPPHLVLALGGTLLITGPLRAALYRSVRGRTPGFPALLSLANVVALIGFFTAYTHPFIEASEPLRSGSLGFRLATGDPTRVVGGMLLQSIILMGAVLLLARGFRLPFGSLTLLFGLTTALAVSMHETWGLILVGLAAGLIADGLVRLLRPGESDTGTRLFAFLVPAILYLLFFGTFKVQGTLSWSFELWGGAVLLAGFAGWLLSYAFFPAKEG